MSGTNQWSKAWPTLNDNTPYTLWLRATDNALNISTHPNAGCCTSQLDANRNADGTTALSFTYDNAPRSRS